MHSYRNDSRSEVEVNNDDHEGSVFVRARARVYVMIDGYEGSYPSPPHRPTAIPNPWPALAEAGNIQYAMPITDMLP